MTIYICFLEKIDVYFYIIYSQKLAASLPVAPPATRAAALPPWLRLRSAAAAAASTKHSSWRSPGTSDDSGDDDGMGCTWEMWVKDMMFM